MAADAYQSAYTGAQIDEAIAAVLNGEVGGGSNSGASGLEVVTTAGTGTAYTAAVSSITALTAGVSFIMIPHVVSKSTSPTLNVNGLGAKYIRRSAPDTSSSVMVGASLAWLTKDYPVLLVYNGVYWVAQALTAEIQDATGIIIGGGAAGQAYSDITGGDARSSSLDEVIAFILKNAVFNSSSDSGSGDITM